jgi:DNA-directed RNA polymerase subunit M/transcription elongation factor TFIIS
MQPRDDLCVVTLDPRTARTRLRATHLLSKSITAAVPTTTKSGRARRQRTAVIARQLEETIYLVSVQQKVDYRKKVLEIAWNLEKNGVFLLSRYEPRVIVYLDDQKLAENTDVADWWAEHNQRIRHQRSLLNEEAKFEETEQLSSGLTCNRCHSRLIDIQQQQTRSADEGMTVFCTCKKCGMRWKM